MLSSMSCTARPFIHVEIAWKSCCSIRRDSRRRCPCPTGEQPWELLSTQSEQHADTLGQCLFLCSNAGAKDNNGSFGRVLATAAQLLWECCGIATGWSVNSLCSEGMGQLLQLTSTATCSMTFQHPSFPPNRTLGSALLQTTKVSSNAFCLVFLQELMQCFQAPPLFQTHRGQRDHPD